MINRHASEHEPRTRAELLAFIETSRIASRGREVGSSLGAILECAIKLMKADQGSVMLADENGDLRIVASRGISEEIQKEAVTRSGKGIAGSVFETGHALLLPSPLDVSRFEGYVAKQRPINSALCVPLQSRERVIGVLNLNLIRPSSNFDEEDLSLASLFAEHAAIAISNAEMLGRVQRNASELETLRASSARLAASLDLDVVADAALTEALAISNSTSGILLLSDSSQIDLARYRGFSRDSVRELITEITQRKLLDGAGPFDAKALQVPSRLQRELGARSLAAARVPGPSGSRGLLAVALAEEEIRGTDVLTAYAAEAGLAIANARLHAQVQSKEEELSTIVEAINKPILLVDRHGLFRAINPAAAELFHLTPDFEIGQPARGRLGDLVEDDLFSQTDGSREIILPVQGDPHVWRITFTTTRSGAVYGGRLLVAEDVTSQRELEQRKADFLAMIGHELRTPLTVIKGFASTLARTDIELTPAVRATAITSILDQSAKLNQMIEDLLYVSRIENKVPPLHLTWSDVAVFVEELLDDYRARDSGRSFTLHTSGGAALSLMFDRTRTAQVVRHLLDNAMKYSEEGSPVSVSIENESSQVKITVIDKGAGIFSGDLPRLFRVFGQLDSSTTRKHGGTGIGLSVCKTLVDSMGGRIWAQSILGKGSRFCFTIPKDPPQSERII